MLLGREVLMPVWVLVIVQIVKNAVSSTGNEAKKKGQKKGSEGDQDGK